MPNQLNELQVNKIEQFCKDVDMYEAVKFVLFAILFSDGVFDPTKPINTRNGAFGIIAQRYSDGKEVTNDELGQALRAKFEGVHTLLDGFENLKNIKSKTEKGIESPYNEAI
jgi:hypothetical protein